MYSIAVYLVRYQDLGSVSMYTATFLSVIHVAICLPAIYGRNHPFCCDKHKFNWQTSKHNYTSTRENHLLRN